MSLATLGAVPAATNELPLPDTSSLSLGEVLILSGGGGTTEAVVIRSIASGRNIGATVSRGALGTLRLAHATPTTVTIYDPSGGGGGGGVTVDNGVDPPFTADTLIASGAVEGPAGTATLPLSISLIGPYHIAHDTPALFDTGVDLVALANGVTVIRAWAIASEPFASANPADFDVRLTIGVGSGGGGVTVTDDPRFAVRAQPIVEALSEAGAVSLQPPLSNVATVAAVGQSLFASAQNNGDALVGGQADVYAIIATPASS